MGEKTNSKRTKVNELSLSCVYCLIEARICTFSGIQPLGSLASKLKLHNTSHTNTDQTVTDKIERNRNINKFREKSLTSERIRL